MPHNMKSVLIINAAESDEETATNFMNWRRDNGMSAVADKYVPDAETTRKMLYD